MFMKRRFCSAISLLAILGLSISSASAADTASLDPAGYIRDWVMLAPIALPEGAPTGDLLLREQVKNEASLKPREGDTIKINGKDLIWKNVTTATNFFDFNAILKSINDQAAGYMVTYLEC